MKDLFVLVVIHESPPPPISSCSVSNNAFFEGED